MARPPLADRLRDLVRVVPRERRIAVGVALVLFAGALVFARHGPPISNGPNIVVILTDDQSPETFPHAPPAMPYLQSRVLDPNDHWISFPRAFISTPLCCPSRSTILSGQYAFRTGVHANGDGRLFDDSSTMATWLHDAGYWTGLVGKYLNRYPFGGPPFVPPGWDRWAVKMHGDVTSVYFDYRLFEDGRVVQYGLEPQNYMTDVLSDKAVDFIETAPPGRPFFLYYAPTAPHPPWVPAARDEGAFADLTIPARPAFNEEDVSDKPLWVQERQPLTEEKQQLAAFQHRNEFETLLAVDDGVRRIFEALQAKGALDDTVVVFLSDNGYSFGDHRWVGKKCAYDECTRTPFYVRVPGAESGENGTVISNADLAPTIAALGETSPGIKQDGESLVRLLEDGGTPARPGVLLQWFGDADIPAWAGLRTVHYLFVQYETGERELYDLTGAKGPPDPYLLENVAGHERYTKVEARLQDQVLHILGPAAPNYPASPPPTLATP